MRRTPVVTCLIVGALLGGACQPTLDDRPWLVRSLELVGWKAEPAEARPGTSVTFQVAALDPAGAADGTGTAWSFCHVPKPVDEARVVSPRCLSPAAPDAVGDPVTLAVPIDACALYGPDVAQPAPGSPPTRPRDPDDSGGYFQPLTLALGSALAVGLMRVTCDLPDASLQVARAFQAAYQPNQNPTIVGLSADGAAASSSTDVPGALVAGSSVRLQASWAAGSRETYARYDRAIGMVVADTETLVASWYVTGGTLDAPVVSVTDPVTASVAASWHVPATTGPLQVTFTLRDSRGGSDFATASFVVEPGPP